VVALLLAQVVGVDDVGMVQAGHQAGLPGEALKENLCYSGGYERIRYANL
jgi:hypothetical protein